MEWNNDQWCKSSGRSLSHGELDILAGIPRQLHGAGLQSSQSINKAAKSKKIGLSGCVAFEANFEINKSCIEGKYHFVNLTVDL